MKLITNFKDYYDYVIEVRGIDPKAVYNRTPPYVPYHVGYSDVTYPTDWLYQQNLKYNTRSYLIAFCGTMYFILRYQGKFYYGEDYKNIEKVSFEKDWVQFHLKSTTLNEQYNAPVLLLKKGNFKDDPKDKRYYTWELVVDGQTDTPVVPRLDDFKFSNLVSAEEAYVRITNFLLREKEVKDNRTDKEKIIAKGFDKVTSFRRM